MNDFMALMADSESSAGESGRETNDETADLGAAPRGVDLEVSAERSVCSCKYHRLWQMLLTCGLNMPLGPLYTFSLYSSARIPRDKRLSLTYLSERKSPVKGGKSSCATLSIMPAL